MLRVFWWLLGAFTAWWVERAYSLGLIGLRGSILYKGSTKFETATRTVLEVSSAPNKGFCREGVIGFRLGYKGSLT